MAARRLTRNQRTEVKLQHRHTWQNEPHQGHLLVQTREPLLVSVFFFPKIDLVDIHPSQASRRNSREAKNRSLFPPLCCNAEVMRRTGVQDRTGVQINSSVYCNYGDGPVKTTHACFNTTGESLHPPHPRFHLRIDPSHENRAGTQEPRFTGTRCGRTRRRRERPASRKEGEEEKE